MPHVSVGNVRLSYQVYGQGVPIVLIPPPAVGCSVFRRQVQGLSRDFCVIVFELRGHGSSTPSPTPLSYAVVAADILAILDELNIRSAVLCGYSMGGSIALECIRTFPQRVLGVVAIGGFSEVTDLRMRSEIHSAIFCCRYNAMRTLGLGLALANADDRRSFHMMYQSCLHSDFHDVAALFTCALQFHCTADLPKLNTPVQLIFGSKDRRLYRYADLLQSGLPDREVVFLPDAGHQMPMKHAAAVNACVRDFVLQLHHRGGPSQPVSLPSALTSQLVGDLNEHGTAGQNPKELL